jgi:quinol monooxygenase YgiN
MVQAEPWPDPTTSVVSLVAQIRALPGHEAEVESLLAQFGQTVRQEAGNLIFAVNKSATDSRLFIVYEEYASQEAFQAHLQAEHGIIFNASLAPLVVGGRSELHMLEPVIPENSRR